MSDSYAHIVVLNWKKSNVLAELGIDAERRSIYRDIEEINKALWLLENEDDDADIFAAEKAIETDENDSEKFIVYDRHLKDFRVVRRKYELSDIRLMAECIYASRYISQSEAERLVDIIILLQFDNERVFVARKNPDKGQQTTSVSYIEVGDKIEVPESCNFSANTNSAGIEKALTQRIGISENLNMPPNGQSRLPLAAYGKTCLTVRHVFRQIDMEFSVWYNRDNKSEICGGEQYAMLLIKNLETPRLTIRSWQKSDKDFTLSLWGDKENGKYMSDPIRENMDEAYLKCVDEMEDNPDGYYLVAEWKEDGTPVGTCCIFPENENYDIGYCVSKDHWKEGLGTEVIDAIIRWVKAEGGKSITGEVADINLASVALLRKFGFSEDRKTRYKKWGEETYFDAHYYKLNLE